MPYVHYRCPAARPKIILRRTSKVSTTTQGAAGWFSRHTDELRERMKSIHVSTSAAALALAVMLSLTSKAVHPEGPVLKSSNPNQFDHWYGRAGGTTGTNRIDTLNEATFPPPNVSLSYDKDIAERTNMQREGVDNTEIGIAYDKGIAARTNMGRSQPEATSEVAKSQK
jgi:hypothetical protein